MPNLAMLSLMILLPLSALSPLSAKASSGLPVENMPPQDYYFDVLLDGKPIGEHRFQFQPVENGYQLQSRADYLVKVLLIPFYEYSHASDELWREGCVRHIQSTTDDNGKDYHVQGQQVEGEQEQAERVLAECLDQRLDFSISMVRDGHLYTDSSAMNHYLEGLRKAGVSE